MDSVIKPTVNNIHEVEFCRTKLIYNSDNHPTMMFDPKRLYSIFGMTFKPYTRKQYFEYIKLIQHCNHMININSPLRYNWKPLDKTIDKILIDTQLDKQLKRILMKQMSNKPWKDKFLTSSVKMAYPDYELAIHPVDANKLLNKKLHQKKIIINHYTKELIQL